MRDAALAGRVVAAAVDRRVRGEGLGPDLLRAGVLRRHRRVIPEAPLLEHRAQGGRVEGVGGVLLLLLRRRERRGSPRRELRGGDGEAGEREEEEEEGGSHGRGEVGVDLVRRGGSIWGEAWGFGMSLSLRRCAGLGSSRARRRGR